MARAPGTERVVALNRKARHNYFIDETLEAGLVLTGSEVKSIREGRSNIAESYAAPSDGEMYLVNSYIAEYKQAGPFNHEPRRPRKLLLKRREISRLASAVQREGVSVVPLKLYFNSRGMAKIELGLARGKRKYDKRESERSRDWQRQKARLMRNRG